MALVVAILKVIFVILVLASLALSIYQALQKPPEPPTPSPQEVANMPTAEQGMDVPVLFGTYWIRKSNVVWWGDPRHIKNQVDPSELS